MENTNQIPQQNQIIGTPQLEAPDDNKIEPAALPVEKKEVELVGETKLETVKKILKTTKESIEAVLQLLDMGGEKLDAASGEQGAGQEKTDVSGVLAQALSQEAAVGLGKIVEGIFDGERMISGEGQIYQIPPNYASKSKLVEGDLLKLTITPKGAFIYKQIGPIERDRIRGALLRNEETGEFAVTHDDKVYRVLKASITYFHGEQGDEVVILVPKKSPSRWAAVENVVKRGTPQTPLT